MSLLLPFDLCDSINISDLGKGFSLEIEDGTCVKDNIFLSNQNDVISKNISSISNKLTLIKGHESIKSALDISDEFGIISNKYIGNYLDSITKSDRNNDSLTFIFTKRIVSKVIELNPHSQLSEDTQLASDIDSFKSKFGLFFIKKIHYGAYLNIKITLQSNDECLFQDLKNKLSGSVDFGKFSSVVGLHKCNLKLKFSIEDMGGCKQKMAKKSIQSFKETVLLVNSFQVDQDDKSLVPVRIELSPIERITNCLNAFGEKEFSNYIDRVSLIGRYNLDLQQILNQLNTFRSSIQKIKRISNLKDYLDSLYLSVSDSISILEESQDDFVSFYCNGMDSILNSKLPDLVTIDDEINKAKRLIGSTFTKTPKGNWFGSSIDGIPVYEGRYEYNNGSTFHGLCLNGKRHGDGLMNFVAGNIDQLKTIEGKWVNDQLSFPSTITFVNKSQPIQVTTEKQCQELRIQYKDSIMCTNNNSIEINDYSTSDEHIFKFSVKVELIHDQLFSRFFERLKKSIDDRKRYFFLFLGMTGTGKTTMIEFILNILTGQVHSPTTLRAVSLEDNGIGKSKTNSVCRYEVEYVLNGTWMFGITIIDTPGFADVGGLEKDCEHIKSILKTVGKLERIDCVSYVVNGSLTRKTLEPLKVLCNVFSILPHEAFNCVSTFITFCDNANQANDVRNVLNEMLNGIKDKPAVFIDNPWAQHLSNKFRSSYSNQADEAALLGVDNSDDLQRMLESKTQVIQDFIIRRIESKSSFQPAGMSVLHQLKEELLSKLKSLAITDQKLSTTTNLYKELTDVKIEALLENCKSISIDDWLKDRGYALVDGKPKAKVMGSIPWPGGVHSTVCFAPQCLNMVCHQGCTIKFTPTKGDNVFIKCKAFHKHQNCQVCPSKCSYQQHVHVRFQLEWFENDKVLEAYESIKKGAAETIKKSDELKAEAEDLKQQYSQELQEFSKLKIKFKDLSVLGDMLLILSSTKRTYEQHYEIAIKVNDQERANNIQQIIEQLDSFIKALNETDTSNQCNQFHLVYDRSIDLLNKLKNIAFR